jgi:hypothetical protein
VADNRLGGLKRSSSRRETNLRGEATDNALDIFKKLAASNAPRRAFSEKKHAPLPFLFQIARLRYI